MRTVDEILRYIEDEIEYLHLSDSVFYSGVGNEYFIGNEHQPRIRQFEKLYAFITESEESVSGR